jgi:hypothetical protein
LATSVTARQPQAQGIDTCHVYVVDNEKAQRAVANALQIKDPKSRQEALVKSTQEAQTQFPDFQPEVGEEKLTTKIFNVPGSKHIVTASVFYTDESLKATKGCCDSMLAGIIVSQKAFQSALTVTNAAIGEIPYDERSDTLRVKTFSEINKKIYLVGIECRIHRGHL